MRPIYDSGSLVADSLLDKNHDFKVPNSWALQYSQKETFRQNRAETVLLCIEANFFLDKYISHKSYPTVIEKGLGPVSAEEVFFV